MRYCVGIDPGLTRTGVVILREDGMLCDYATFAADDSTYKSQPRARDLASKILDFIDNDAKALSGTGVEVTVCIERPILGKNAKNFEKQIRLFSTIINNMIDVYTDDVIEVDPQTVKKVGAGSGAAPKALIIANSPFDKNMPDDTLCGTDWNTPKQKAEEAQKNREALADAWAIAKCGLQSPPVGTRYGIHSGGGARLCLQS